MKILYTPPQSGKTTFLATWVKEGPNRILVVINEREKERVMRVFELKYNQVETLETILHNYCTPALEMKELALDNIDLMMKQLIPHSNVIICTISDIETPKNFRKRK